MIFSADIKEIQSEKKYRDIYLAEMQTTLKMITKKWSDKIQKINFVRYILYIFFAINN